MFELRESELTEKILAGEFTLEGLAAIVAAEKAEDAKKAEHSFTTEFLEKEAN